MIPRKIKTKGKRSQVIIATEGSVTEPDYLYLVCKLFKTQPSVIVPHGFSSSPKKILSKLVAFLNNITLEKGDVVWLVADVDNWGGQISHLITWIENQNRRMTGIKYGCSISNPCFEYWLLLNFEDGTKIKQTKEILHRLKPYRKHYNKRIPKNFVTKGEIEEAIRRARKRPLSPDGLPEDFGSTTMHKLLETAWKINPL